MSAKIRTSGAHPSPALTILMESDRYAAYCLPLARAAVQLGKPVHIHFTHRGVHLLDSYEIDHLRQWAQVTICLESYQAARRCEDQILPEAESAAFLELMVAPGYGVNLIKHSTRVVIF